MVTGNAVNSDAGQIVPAGRRSREQTAGRCRDRRIAGHSRDIGPVTSGKEPRVRTRSFATGVVGAGLILALASCNPYDPAQRAVGGGLVGAGAGAAIGRRSGRRCRCCDGCRRWRRGGPCRRRPDNASAAAPAALLTPAARGLLGRSGPGGQSGDADLINSATSRTATGAPPAEGAVASISRGAFGRTIGIGGATAGFVPAPKGEPWLGRRRPIC